MRPSTATSTLAGFVLAALVSLRTGAYAQEDYLVSRRLSEKHYRRSEPFNLTLYHVNDVHAHLDEIQTSGQDCPNPSTGCYGGYARIKGVVDSRRNDTPNNNTLFLNIGDEFQGTLFYSFYGGEKIGETINQLGFDAMVLGNHEFDRGETYLGEFVNNLTIPVLCANIDTQEPVLNATLKPYKVFPELKTALIALTTDTIPSISNPNKDTTFSSPISTAQFWADYVYANEPDVDRIVAMTHIGYEQDIALAQQTKGIHMIVGGHSHTLLGDMDGAAGKYPTIVENEDGEEVFVVTAWRYGVYPGYIDVEFDGKNVVSYTGGPILLDNTTQQDVEMQKQIKEWRGPFEEYANVVIGETTVLLDRTVCKSTECNLGDLTCDAMIAARSSQSPISGCILNGGGIRASIDIGDITRGEVITSFPFGNALTEMTLTGEDLWKVFEGAASKVSQFNGQAVISLPQTGGLKVLYNPNNEVGKRLISLTVVGEDGGEGELVDFGKNYTVVTSDFVAGGGDNIVPAVSEMIVLDTLDEILTAYINATSPISLEMQGRYEVTDQTEPLHVLPSSTA